MKRSVSGSGKRCTEHVAKGLICLDCRADNFLLFNKKILATTDRQSVVAFFLGGRNGAREIRM